MKKINLCLLVLLLMPALQALSVEDMVLTRVVEAPSGLLYGVTRSHGFVVSSDAEHWEQRNNGLPIQVVYPFSGKEFQDLTAISVDPFDETRIVVTTALGVYLSEDQGQLWTSIPLGDPVRPSNFFTSVALSPHDKNTIAIGSSFNGIFETQNRGVSWTRITDRTNIIFRGAGFQEEVSALAYHPERNGEILFAAGFGNGLYRVIANRGLWQRVDSPVNDSDESVRGLIYTQHGDEWRYRIVTNENIWKFVGNEWHAVQGAERLPAPQLSVEESLRMAKASEKYGLFIRADKATGQALQDHLAMMKEQGMNAVVVDFKDDLGRLTYDTQLEYPRQIRAVHEYFKIDELLKACRDAGVYVIARVVAFQDRSLHRAEGKKYAIWDRARDDGWGQIRNGEQIDFWVDPYHPDVWDYNLSIAKELQERGVDEIQWDYIRFPTDGPTQNILFRHKPDGMRGIDAMESFLRYTREHLYIPVSVDLFGFNAYYRMGNWNGQNLEIYTRHTDVVSGMYYPSHFPRSFIADMDYLPRAEELYREGTVRALEMADGQAVMRPYIQAFLLGSEREYKEPEYWEYLERQIRGSLNGGAVGYHLWNMSNVYYMVSRSLKEYNIITR